MNLIISRRLSDKVFTGIDIKISTGGRTYRAYGEIKVPCSHSVGENYNLHVEPPSFGNFFDVRKGEVSYHAGEQELTEDGKWKREGRQVCKPSRLISHLMEVCGVRIECDSSRGNQELEEKLRRRMLELLSTFTSAKGSDVMTSDDPQCIYEMETSERAGTLSSSCMRPESGCGCRNYSGFYNAMKARIAYTLDPEGRLFSRALLWENVVDVPSGKTFKFMDRIYGTEEVIQDMKEWALENGYGYKTEQSYANPEIILPEGERIHDFSYSLESDYYDGFPYVDTLNRMDSQDGLFTLYSRKGAFHSLQNTDGQNVLDTEKETRCAACGAWMDTEDAINIDEEAYCSQCTVYSSHDGQSYLRSECVWSDYHDSYILAEEALSCEDDYVHEDSDCFVTIGGTAYFEDSEKIILCDHCQEYGLSRDSSYSDLLEMDLCLCCWDKAHEEEGYVLVNGEWKEKEEEDEEEEEQEETTRISHNSWTLEFSGNQYVVLEDQKQIEAI